MSEPTVEDALMLVEKELLASYDTQEALEKDRDNWIPEWYLRVLGGIEGAKRAIKQRAEELTRQLDNRAGHLEYLYGDALQREADKLIAAEPKKKSVKLLTGTVGYRTNKGRLFIEDMNKAVVWAVENLDNGQLELAIKEFKADRVLPVLSPALKAIAITELKITPLKDHLEATGELPDGCQVGESVETFYATPAVAKLEGGK